MKRKTIDHGEVFGKYAFIKVSYSDSIKKTYNSRKGVTIQ